MLDKIVEKSPAKINLFLKIINRREDGFHNIRTGVTFIDLYDEVVVKPCIAVVSAEYSTISPLSNP